MPVLFLLLFCSNQGMQMARNFWLSAWADENQKISDNGNALDEGIGLGIRLAVYAAFGVVEGGREF